MPDMVFRVGMGSSCGVATSVALTRQMGSSR